MKKISLLILCCSIISMTAFAQKGKNKCAQLKEMKTELKAHYTTTMSPELQIIQTNLLGQLSETDLQAVKKLQADQKALMAEKKQLKTKGKGKKGKKDKKAKKVKTEEAAPNQALIQKQKAINEALKPIMERNKAAILATDKAIVVKNATWKKERKAIKDKYAEYECVQTALEKAQAKGRKKINTKQRIKPYDGKGKKNKKGKQATKGANKKMRKAASFLLWDAKGYSMPKQVSETNSTEQN
jgi:hypothetical protein